MKFVFFAFMLFVILHNDFALILRSKTLFKCKKHAMIFLFKISHHMFLRVLFCIIVTFLNAFKAYFLSLIFPCFLLKKFYVLHKNIYNVNLCSICFIVGFKSILNPVINHCNCCCVSALASSPFLGQ